MPGPILYGENDADLTIVGWGSVKGVVMDAVNELRTNDQELKVNFLHFNVLWPFAKARAKAVLGRAKNILLVENNKTGQLADLIRQEVGVEIKNKFLKYDGRPFFREEVVEEINSIIKKQ